MRRTAVAAALCLATACGTDPAVAPLSEPSVPVSGGPASVSATCSEARGPSVKVIKLLHCGDVVQVKSSDATISPKIPGAITIWNGVLGQNGLPKFVTTAGNKVINVKFGNLRGQATWYCGDNVSGTEVTIHRSAVKAECGLSATGSGELFTNATQIGGLSSLIAHELGHAIEIKHLSFGPQSTDPTDHCVSALPANGLLNGSLCRHEIEIVRYTYGIGDTDPDITKHIATGLDVIGPASLNPGEPGTVTVTDVIFAGAAPSFDPPAASALQYAWTRTPSGIVTLGSSTGASNTIQAVAPGTATIHIELTSPTFEQTDNLAGSDFTVTVVTPPTAPAPPSNLAASAVTATSATISWTNGAVDGDTKTTLEYRVRAAANWTTASSVIPKGATSFGLSGLTPLTLYDVQAWHVRSGLSSTKTTANSLFTTPALPPLPSITNFHVTSCDRRLSGTKYFNYFQLAWTSATASAGSTFQIGTNTTNNSAGASVIVSYPLTARTGEVGGYLSSQLLMNRWFWIRYIRSGAPGPWTGLADNPLASNQCLL